MTMQRYLSTIVIVILLGAALPAGLRAAKPYNGAEYRTKASYLYGRFEVRLKSQGREGMLASFFTYNDNYPATDWNEIDIEILGRYTDDVQFNTITPGQVNHVSHQYVGFDPSRDYHVYGFEWTPSYVAWFIDSVEVYRQTGGHIATLTIPQKIMMNVWLPAAVGWAGTWNEAVLPAFAFYDWVSYASYTPGSGTVGTGNNFTPQWTDNFDSWDQARWDKASHTWNGNNCDFTPANAVFQDGKLILCLTKSTAQGYVDTTPPSVLWARAEGDSIRMQFSEEVEQASAETASNYLLTKGSVAAAHLLDDQKTVVLSVPGVDTSGITSVIEKNVRDLWSAPNAMAPSVTPLIRSPRLTFPVKINVGGTATSGYLADTVWSPSVEYGRLDGQTAYYNGVTIAGTAEPEIYRSEAYAMGEYKVRVPNGRYFVVLMMAENYFTNPGLRTMTIWVEGNQVATNLDLMSSVGFRAACVRTKIVDVADGVLDIHFQGILDNPLLNGLTITPVPAGVNEQRGPGLRPEIIRLLPNYPNPFNGGTTLSFELPRRDRIMLRVYDTLGRTVREQSLGELPVGRSDFYWNARDNRGNSLPSGVYYCVLEGSAGRAMQKLLYLR